MRTETRPQTISELGVGRGLLTGLLLRHLAAAGSLTSAELAHRLGVGVDVIEPILEELGHSHFVDRRGYSEDPELTSRPLTHRLNLAISGAGRKRAAEVAAVTSHYLGPCPIGLPHAVELVRRQAEGHPEVLPSAVRSALSELELDMRLVDQVGVAMSSRASTFLYGPPGNGKSSIARSMSRLLGGAIEVPYAVAVGDAIVRVLDPAYHRPAGGGAPADRRLALVTRPLVRAGGELQLSQLDLTYDPLARYYEASLQWKAAGGVLVIDDFGRQVESPTRLLNRFIVPMEEGVDYLDLGAHGQKIEVPFTCQIVFSTNLAPRDLVDEAFLRRISHKILVPDPTPEEYRRILERECARRGVEVAPGAVDHLLGLYDDRPLRGSHPKQIVGHLIHSAAYRGEPVLATKDAIETAFQAYLNPAFLGGIGLAYVNADRDRSV